ncbi:heme lyase NrfEFG subunit NrfF [Shewanella sp. D64]|nr:MULTISPECIES: heme lyase NrfEFG subunit NrfF [unclassified Shewanella]MEC4728795.1 heme lyase NrfEFG subunit NrfF [Shewanella sp. D64]MEC4740705.1 heme lyase NrfEFG subunit NrfF [Shewanella sp. E94]WBJ95229.1 heme lyase NrfEFG subunit NrfF [Shewanella sp. MTB7]
MIKYMAQLSSVVLLSLVMISGVFATPVDTYEFKSVDNQKRALELAHSLRCPQCQNQNLIDSNSPVAQDLRLEVYQMVDAGKDDDEVIEFMTSRYGEFVLYKPRMEAKTFALWLGPVALLIFGLLVGFIFIRKQRITELDDQEISVEEQKELDKLLKRDSK